MHLILTLSILLHREQPNQQPTTLEHEYCNTHTSTNYYPMANHKPKTKTKTKQPNSPNKQPPPGPSSPSAAPSQGLSGRLFGLLKKFPMQITSPSKEIPPPPSPQDDPHTTESEDGSESEQDQEEEEEGEEEQEEEEEGLEEEDEQEEEEEEEEETEQEIVTETEEEEEEEEDPLGDEQCKAIMENYLLETSTRTNLLKNRIQTHFRPALRRRLDFELSRITPSIANVTALDYHQRDQGVLRRTMEHVARLAIEQKTISIGIKRSQSQQDQIWDEKEKDHHRKRQRQLTNNSGSVSSKSSKQTVDPHEPSRANGGNNGRAPVRSKPPTSRSNTGGAHGRKQSNASLEPTELNPRLPSTPLISEHKPVRLARRNESLLSVNGSPVISYAPDEIQGLPNSTSAATIISSKFSELFPASSASSSSLALDHHHLPSSSSHLFGNPSNLNQLPQISQFTFVEKSKWNQLEAQLNSLEIDQSQKKKLDDLLKGCLNFGEN
ncbi:hypothetical protein PGTUg99_022383 [Puccinia graminis f. sp. tritici]|uniref:Uncharacterized protein n=1 Tax=Puccinia graminis f. sp. tritici TaxID=56615 RepID=A0A5B0S553_PUCGR|nr:hypothetical protein PGTUg99_022383 [Puccinia graminis f. sp. tritici]